jgi:hypothetical protein
MHPLVYEASSVSVSMFDQVANLFVMNLDIENERKEITKKWQKIKENKWKSNERKEPKQESETRKRRISEEKEENKKERNGKPKQEKSGAMKGESLTYERMIDTQVLNIHFHFSSEASIFNFVQHYWSIDQGRPINGQETVHAQT